MSTTDTTTHDYTTGVPRHHHSLYLDDGNFVIQVENAIFKVHRSFLVKYSTVIREMFDAPQKGDINEGTDENPLILKGDSAVGWALFLESHYDSPSLFAEQEVNGERLLAILPIAHKYCMELMESGIIKLLDSIIDSKTLYDKALKGLTKCSQKPNLEQAKRIGLDAYFAIMDTSTRCSYAFCRSPLAITQQCQKCKNWQ